MKIIIETVTVGELPEDKNLQTNSVFFLNRIWDLTKSINLRTQRNCQK